MAAERRRSATTPALTFYRKGLNDAEKACLDAAAEVKGLDEEIALLRVKVHSVVAAEQQDMDVLLKGVRLLVQAVATRYRISGAAEQDLLQSVVGVMEGLGAALMPEAADAR